MIQCAEIVPDVSFNQSNSVEFLSLILKMIETCILRLLEDNEFVSLQVHDTLVTELQFKRLVLQILDSFMRSPIPFLFNDIGLEVCKFLKTFFSTFNHEVSWLLKRDVVLALWMHYIILFMRFLECMLIGLLPIFGCSDDTIPFQKGFLEIFTLNLLQVKVCLQTMIQLLLLRKQLVHYLHNWVVVPETVRILITT